MGVGAGALALGWGTLVEPLRLDVREERAALPGLPEAWRGGELALFADVQVGTWMGGAAVRTARRLVRRIIERRPAAALIAGDLVYETVVRPQETIPVAVDLVRPLPEAGIPTIAVLGNHDHGMETERSGIAQRGVAATLAGALRSAGVTVLENEVAALRPPGVGNGDWSERAETDVLYIAGISDHMAGRDRPREAVARVPQGAARVVLMHDPASFPALEGGTAPLALAGHTHGGQIRVPGVPFLNVSRLPPMNKRWPDYCDGWIEGYGEPGNRLYVNRGVGFSYVPVRIGCPPELTFIRLERAER